MNALPAPYRWALLDPSDSSSQKEEATTSSMTPRMTETEFEQAVANAIPSMLRMAERVSTDKDLAEEAVQDALLKVARSWKTFRGESAFETWLCRIVIHAVRDRIGRRKHSVPLDNVLDEASAEQNGPQQKAIVAEQADRVRGAVGQLPERQREVLTLYTWEAMQPSEIADLLEISTQNVHANLYEARKQLKLMLKGELDSD